MKLRTVIAAVALVLTAGGGCSPARDPSGPSPSVAPLPPSAPPSASVASAPNLPAPTAASSVPEAAPSAAAAPAATPEPNPAPPADVARTLRYRELFTGSLPYRARLRTWTLTIGKDDRFLLVAERAEAAENSLILGKAKPFGVGKLMEQRKVAGTVARHPGGALELRFADASLPRIACAPGRVQALAAGALLKLTPIPGENANHATWTPSARKPVEVLRCARGWLAEPASWSDEPQPEALLFSDLPGVEYAHDNDDMVVQKGGVRRMLPSP